ncbi:MAG: F0F1 ATP synthase subunit delta [Gammaproteobacteria bacterium]|nr:F0F1 ATP synthase subunit delta [Gammaproteobacteria bacterium]MCI0590160.1 F0F1 ATP synthase subunit delta [Gammaproteobacteria bacterium]
MEQANTIARPYALAAFQQAKSEGNLAQWSDMLRLLTVVVLDPTMKRVISNPRITSARLLDLVLDICGDRLSATGQNFVKVLVNGERLEFAPSTSKLFEEYRADAERLEKVEVASAYDLEPQQEEMIVNSMKKRLGKDIELTKVIDKDLIGGAVIRAGDLVIDLSLRGRLKHLTKEMK